MKKLFAVLVISSLILSGGCASTGTTGSSGPAVDPDAPKAKSVKEWLSNQPRSKRKGFLGALAGAGVGALAAAATGKNVWAGAAIGAVAGGVAGYLVGERQDKVFAGRDKAVEAIDYKPEQGYVIQIQEVRFDPARVEPGGEAEMYVRYLVVGPDPKESITVQAYTGIKYDDAYVDGRGPEEFEVPKGGGIVETRSMVKLPAKAPAGTYAIEANFTDPDGRFENTRDSPLYVEAAAG